MQLFEAEQGFKLISSSWTSFDLGTNSPGKEEASKRPHGHFCLFSQNMYFPICNQHLNIITALSPHVFTLRAQVQAVLTMKTSFTFYKALKQYYDERFLEQHLFS